MERRQFTDEFKREAVHLARQPGTSRAEISRDLGINTNMLHRWVREYESNPSKVTGGKNEAVSSGVFRCLQVSSGDFERMRRELAKVRTERDILKKALAYFALDPK